MDIENLLHKYFEGETSAGEEKQIRNYFSSAEEIPPDLMVYKPMFAYFDEEISKQEQKTKQKKFVWKRSFTYLVSGIAATILLIVGIGNQVRMKDPCLCLENYVVINGRCYTDMETIRSLAFEALQEVATPANEYFPDDMMDNPVEQAIVRDQLRELGSIFNDEE